MKEKKKEAGNKLQGKKTLIRKKKKRGKKREVFVCLYIQVSNFFFFSVSYGKFDYNPILLEMNLFFLTCINPFIATFFRTFEPIIIHF